jgi:hypothetical protein
LSLNKTIEDIKFHITQNNHKLIIILGDKNTNNLLLEKLKSLENIDILNLNLLLSRILITLKKNEQNNPDELIENTLFKNLTKDVILLSHINILFDINLKWDPLDIFKKLSRNKMIIVLWDGKLTKRGLEYASHPHLENIYYSIDKFEEILILGTVNHIL